MLGGYCLNSEQKGQEKNLDQQGKSPDEAAEITTGYQVPVIRPCMSIIPP